MKRKLILFDKEKINIDLVNLVFKQENIEIIGFTKETEFITHIAKHKEIEVIIVDLKNLKRNYINFLKKIKNLNPLVHLIVILDDPDLDFVVDLSKINISDIIIKPYELAWLRKIVKDGFRKRETLTRLQA